MSVHDELAIARHALIDLVRSVGRLQTRLGDVLDVRAGYRRTPTA